MLNIGSVGQSAAKLIAVKVGVLKKKSAASAIPAKVCASAIGPGSTPTGSESFSKYTATLQPFDLQTLYYLYKEISIPS